MKTEFQKDLEKLGYKTECSQSGRVMIKANHIDVKNICINLRQYEADLNAMDIHPEYAPKDLRYSLKIVFPTIFYNIGNCKSSLQKSLEHFGYICSKTADNKLFVVVKTLEEILILGSKYKEESFKENINISEYDYDDGYKIVFTNINYGTED